VILIVSSRVDPTAVRVADELSRRGASFFWFDTKDFPSSAEITVRYSTSGATRATLRQGDEFLDFASVGVVWYRRPGFPVPHVEVTDAKMREGIIEECLTFLTDLWQSLDCAWVPAPFATIRRAEPKGFQLKTAGALGFTLPETVISNNPDELLNLYREQAGQLISKRVASRPLRTWNTEVRYAEPVGARDIGYAAALRLCPVILQAYIPKSVELRITVVGKSVFAAEIHSQETNRTRHDWRRYDLETTRHEPHQLPDAVAGQCVRLVEELGLCYGAIDMVLTPDGRYVFLEINPNGQYLWVEDLARLPITPAICDLLISRDAERSWAP